MRREEINDGLNKIKLHSGAPAKDVMKKPRTIIVHGTTCDASQCSFGKTTGVIIMDYHFIV